MSIQTPAISITDPEPQAEDGFDMGDADFTAPKDLEALATELLEQTPNLNQVPTASLVRSVDVAAMSLYDTKSILPKMAFHMYGEYKYGGMWKNKHEYVSAKIKGKAKAENKPKYGTQGPHRRHRKLGKNVKKEEGGKVKIGMDDGRSDIEVSDVSDEDFGEEHLNAKSGSHIQVNKAVG